MSKHTPGPWVLKETCSSFEIKGEFKLSKNSFITCHQWSDGDYGSTRKQAEANALLIAAAPELLEVIKNMVALDSSSAQEDCVGRQYWMAAIDNARAAIAKATGCAS